MNLLPFALLPGLTAAICAAHDAIQDGVEFLRAHMPAQDRNSYAEVVRKSTSPWLPIDCHWAAGSVGTLPNNRSPLSRSQNLSR